MISKALEQLGLSEKETDVYVALLKSGPSTPLQLAQHTHLKRPTIYLLLDTLKRRGLVEIQTRGLKNTWAAVDPVHLLEILRDRQSDIEDALPELRSYYRLRGNRSIIKYYEGIEGVKRAYDSILHDIRNGDPFYVIADTPNWHDLDYQWLEKYSERRSRRRLDVKVLLKDSKEAQQFKARESSLHMEVKMLSNPITLVGDVIISPQMLILHNFTPPITAAVIEHDDLIKTHLSLFEYMWNMAP